jgi:glycosyltransferase involved in cell wall biosynthesis
VADEVRHLRDTVRLMPAVAPSEVPRWIRSFDVCLVLAGAGPFHYSPLKLYEYMGCGRAVVAQGAGDLGAVVEDGRDALLVPQGDPEAAVEAIMRVRDDGGLRRRLEAGSRATAVREASWKVRAVSVVTAMRERGLVPPGW